MQKMIVISVLVFALSIGSLKALTSETLHHAYGETTFLLEIGLSNSPFHLCLIKGDLETVQKLIEQGADVNQKRYDLCHVCCPPQPGGYLKSYHCKGGQLKN